PKRSDTERRHSSSHSALRPKPAYTTDFKMMTNTTRPGVMTGLAHLDLVAIFRSAIEVAEAAAAVEPSESADPTDAFAAFSSPAFELWTKRQGELRRIGEETDRLKRLLGYSESEAGVHSKWECYDQRFNSTVHDRVVRLGLLKLATSAIDLSGFATWHELQWS